MRLLWLFLTKKALLNGSFQTLHFAPEKCLNRALSNVFLVYETSDPQAKAVHHRWDLQKIDCPSDHWDLLICSHVLEHIPDDTAALREIFRILKPEAQALILVPMKEGPTLDGLHFSQDERTRYLGQNDHIRIYGSDFETLLKSIGFKVKAWKAAEFLDSSEIDRFGLNHDEILFQTIRPQTIDAPTDAV